jgi:hypothetical protein
MAGYGGGCWNESWGQHRWLKDGELQNEKELNSLALALGCARMVYLCCRSPGVARLLGALPAPTSYKYYLSMNYEEI